MAKPPKKRVKKITNVDIQRRNVSNITNICYQRLKFIGDCFHEPRAMGIQRLWTDLRGAFHELGMETFLRHLARDMDWSLTVSSYFKDKDDPERIHCVQSTAVFRKVNLEEMSCNLSRIIIECINRTLDADDRCNNDNFIYYAYLFTPEFHSSHFEIADSFSNMMINLDDIGEFEPFGEQLPGRPSDRETIPLAIKNNGLFPKVSDISYWIESETLLTDVILHKDFE